ncbi:MAG: M50 family metallopeptidase [Anaerolineae bacterium]
MALTVVAFVVTLGVLVFVHELGHFVAAKRMGIGVEEFGFGYPPRVFTLGRRGGTVYTVNAIPFGGFVRLAGEDNPLVEGGFANAPKWKRLLTLLAGSVMNLVLAVLCFTLAARFESPVSDGVLLREVKAGSPAAGAGIQAGDVVLLADGVRLNSSGALHDYIYSHLGEEIAFTLRRENPAGAVETVVARVVPRPDPPKDEGAIGVVMQPRRTWAESLLYGGGMTVMVIWMTLTLPVLLVQGTLSLGDARPVGPVGIAQLAGGAMQHSLATGWWYPVFFIMGLISAALAVTNLLPLPALDGGRIFFLIVEAIRGKRVNPEKEALVHLVGMVLLIGFMVLITYQDIISPLQLPDWSRVF